MQETLNTFTTKDFAQAVVMSALGYEVLELIKGDANFVRFVINIDPDHAREIWDSYWRREIRVDAKEIMDQIHNLKSRIHSQVRR